MFLEKGNLPGRKNRIIIGYDLSDEHSQISFCRVDGGEPETVSVVEGEEQYDFPTVLARRPDMNQWFFGREARREAESGNGILVEHLLTLALTEETVAVGTETFSPVALLALFMKRSLSLLGMDRAVEETEALAVTVESLDQRTAQVLAEAVSIMQLQTEHVFFQSYGECFYQYMLHQPRELWLGQSLVCEYEGGRLKTYRMECNRRTTPVVVLVEERVYPDPEKSDKALFSVLEESCKSRVVSSAYLVGTGFEGDWYQDSLRYLCRGRRVFRGNNLYSKGACYGAGERLQPGEIGKQYVFLGRDTLKANLGMNVLRGGEDSYYALLNAGVEWYEANKQCEFYLESGNSFSIIITPLTGKESKEVEIILNDLPVRSERTTRIRMTLSLESESDVAITLEDLGFGEIYPATHMIWHEKLRMTD